MTSFVSIIAGSRNDEDYLEPGFAVFRDFSITRTSWPCTTPRSRNTLRRSATRLNAS